MLRVTGFAASHPDDELAASLQAAINDDLTDQEKAKMDTLVDVVLSVTMTTKRLRS